MCAYPGYYGSIIITYRLEHMYTHVNNLLAVSMLTSHDKFRESSYYLIFTKISDWNLSGYILGFVTC